MAFRRHPGLGVPLEGCRNPVELILYVRSQSAHSETALDDIRRMLRDLPSPSVTLTIRDPMLDQNNHDSPITRSSGPRTFILGHVTSPAALLELLAECAPS